MDRALNGYGNSGQRPLPSFIGLNAVPAAVTGFRMLQNKIPQLLIHRAEALQEEFHSMRDTKANRRRIAYADVILRCDARMPNLIFKTLIRPRRIPCRIGISQGQLVIDIGRVV